jgi:hypothetical protein
MAFCLGGVRFLSDDKIRIPIDRRILKLDLSSPIVGRNFIKYRTQNNGKDGASTVETLADPCHATLLA